MIRHCKLTPDQTNAMDLRITLFAVCLALALPASAVYAQDDCEEADCERSDEAAAAAEMDADDSSSDEAEAVSAEDAESEGFEADEPPVDEQEPEAESEPADSGNDEAVDEESPADDPDVTELTEAEEALGAVDDADEATAAEQPSPETPADPPAEPASPPSPAQPAPAEPASPSVDAAALQAFQERRGSCFLGQPIQGPPEHARAQDDSLERGLYCPKRTEESGGPHLTISQYQALFSILGTRFGGDGIRAFALPALPVGYCICLQGHYPRRADTDELGPILQELCRLDASTRTFSSCPDLLPEG